MSKLIAIMAAAAVALSVSIVPAQAAGRCPDRHNVTCPRTTPIPGLPPVAI